MATKKRVSFEFKNQIVPRYIEPLFLKLERGQWYDPSEMANTLRMSGLDVIGRNIVSAHTALWAKVGLGEVKRVAGRGQLFRLNPLAELLADLYHTNQELFFDVFHFLFYSAWPRSLNLTQAPFWMYRQICDELWTHLPTQIDTFKLTAQIQTECRLAFPEESPSFSERTTISVLLWLRALIPPFITKQNAKIKRRATRRPFCTPQLFHLATDLLYTTERLDYGTSLAMDDDKIAAICRVCLLAPERFWEMASLADISMRELEVRQGQWGTSLVLNSPPRWIALPNFAAAEEAPTDPDPEDADEKEEA